MNNEKIAWSLENHVKLRKNYYKLNEIIEKKTLYTWKKYCSRYNKDLRTIKTDLRIYRIDRANL